MACAVVSAVPMATMMGSDSESGKVFVHIPGRNDPVEYLLGASVTVADLKNILQQDYGFGRQYQRLIFQVHFE